ncbi:MAG: hypothetical protein EOP53_27250 [Sphingobacteriales bacterium]|nr:MAG: hypothetical protein EOP53_27250 [Sphingobacteriales bacterium]
MTKENYRTICALLMVSLLCGFLFIMHKITLYLASGSTVPTHIYTFPLSDHGKTLYITQAQYGNLKMMCFVFIINLIIMGFYAYKSELPYGRDWVDK